MTFVTYTYFAVQTGFIFQPQASGIREEYVYNTAIEDGDDYNNTDVLMALEDLNLSGLPRWNNCSMAANNIRTELLTYFTNHSEDGDLDYYRLWSPKDGCQHGAALDQMTMTYTSFTGYLRYAGGFSASLSSAIASLVGAPRVLQVRFFSVANSGMIFESSGNTAAQCENFRIFF